MVRLELTVHTIERVITKDNPFILQGGGYKSKEQQTKTPLTMFTDTSLS